MASAVALALEVLPCRKSQLGAQFSPTFHSTSTEMYACVNCGKVLRSQQGLNYHLAQKPTTCEKYLRKLPNQEKQASMVTNAQIIASMASSATKIVGNDVSTSSLPQLHPQPQPQPQPQSQPQPQAQPPAAAAGFAAARAELQRAGLSEEALAWLGGARVAAQLVS